MPDFAVIGHDKDLLIQALQIFEEQLGEDQLIGTVGAASAGVFEGHIRADADRPGIWAVKTDLGLQVAAVAQLRASEGPAGLRSGFGRSGGCG